jgi:hypothetical protein
MYMYVLVCTHHACTYVCTHHVVCVPTRKHVSCFTCETKYEHECTVHIQLQYEKHFAHFMCEGKCTCTNVSTHTYVRTCIHK